MRRLVRLILLLVLTGSLASTVMMAARIASDPLITPFRQAATAEISARLDRMLAETATPDAITARIRTRLAEEPRNWMALDALRDLALEFHIVLPPELATALITAREDDHGYYAQAASCAQCAYDPAECAITQVMICQMPIALTPIGDIAGIARAGVAYVNEGEVDQIDLALSVVGLGATAMLLTSAGASAFVKAGASLAKLARRMGRMSPGLARMATEAVQDGVNWAALPSVRSIDTLSAAIRMDAFVPLSNTLVDLERLRGATSTTTALHLLPMVNDAADARRLANAAEALGPRLVGRAEMLGKVRLMRATVRWSQTAWALGAGLIGLMLSLAGLMGQGLQSLLFRWLRRAVQRN